MATSPLKRFLRWRAELALDRLDAEVARWLVYDGSLSLAPLDAPFSEWRRKTRERRIELVDALEAAGGRDPWPSVLTLPTQAQREHYRGPRRGN